MCSSYILCSPEHLQFNAKGLHVVNLNIQHFLPKFDEIRIILHENRQIDIFGFSESFLTDNVPDKNIIIPGFKFERKDSENKAGGDIVVYVKDYLTYTRRYDMEFSNIESIWLQINTDGNAQILVNCTYRPPNSPQSWIDEYEKQLILAESSNLDWFAIRDYDINF